MIPARGAGPDGEKDERVAEAERLLPRSRTHWIDGDHDLHAQFPEQVARLLSDATKDGFFE